MSLYPPCENHTALPWFVYSIDDTSTPELYTLSLHDALPISPSSCCSTAASRRTASTSTAAGRSEEHTSELQSRGHLVCRLLLEKKKAGTIISKTTTRSAASS